MAWRKYEQDKTVGNMAIGGNDANGLSTPKPTSVVASVSLFARSLRGSSVHGHPLREKWFPRGF